MGGKMGLISILLVIANFYLTKWLVGSEKQEISDKVKKVSLWVLIILGLIAIAIIFSNDLEGNAMKWFFMSLILVTGGFRSFIDWMYLKGSKQYIVSLLVLVIGVTFTYFII